uniref:Putative transglycosylase n=1 Tax=viral metagenome TaxID=1070528 RepID=A0A6M3JEU9_9ZZZZ
MLVALALTAALRLAPAPVMVPFMATAAGMDVQMACCMVSAESNWDALAVGKLGERGLWQIHPQTWAWAREKMGADTDFALAFDALENTTTALWLIGEGYSHWWSTYPVCMEGCR